MDVFNFCWVTLLSESKKCSVFFDKNTCNIKNDANLDFQKPINRISYLYKFGSYNIYFFHQCLMEFFTKIPDSSKVLEKITSIQNLNLCSMSNGPGTDIVGFLYSLYVLEKPLTKSVSIKVISKHGSWRNLVSKMINSSNVSIPEASTCKLIECNFFEFLSSKAENYLKTADVLLMCNSFSSSIISEKPIHLIIKRITQLLKPEALVFLIFSKENSAYFKELNDFGCFLHGPAEVTLQNMPYNEKISQLVGVNPVCAGKSLFAVWQKEIKCEVNSQNDSDNQLSIGSIWNSSTKLISCTGEATYITSPFQSIPNLKEQFSSYTNISSSSCLESSSQFSSSSNISGDPIKKNNPPVSYDSATWIGHEADLSDENSTSAKNVCPASLSVTESSIKKKRKFGDNQKKKETGTNNMACLLENFENLITKLEGLVNSQGSCSNSHEQSSSNQHCYQNIHQGCYECSQKPCKYNENDSVCCHSVMCLKDPNISHPLCSMHRASNLYNISPEGPCIVIPLQNLSNESLLQILTAASQSCDSVKTSNLLPKEETS